jgi:DNA polymerase-4
MFASCHIAEDEKLRGKPVVVSGSSRRAVVLTASYEARKYGVHAGMPMYLADRRCDHLEVVSPSFELYQKYSSYFFNYIAKHTSMYRAGSIDEAYIDVTDVYEKYGGVVSLAKKMQRDLMEMYHLPVSIGISYTKFLAKMASDMKKPLGITILGPDDLETKLYPLDVKETFGIGKKTVPRLNSIGVNTIGDLLTHPREDIVRKVLKNSYDGVIRRITGKSSDVIEPGDKDDLKQIGNSTTFSKNLFEEAEILAQIYRMVEKVHSRMKRRKVVSKTFSVQLRYADFKTINRSITLSQEIDDLNELKEIAKSLFEKNWDGAEVRHVGFSTGHIIDKSSTYKQLDLFSYEEEEFSEIDIVIKELNNKYKKDIIHKSTKK